MDSFMNAQTSSPWAQQRHCPGELKVIVNSIKYLA